jgi:hypothetical protein
MNEDSIDNQKYRVLVMGLLSTQLWLEVMDELKETNLYRHDLKKLMNTLEKKLEALLGPEYKKIYAEDEESFRTYISFLVQHMDWISKAHFEDVIDLSKGITSGNLKFVHNSEKK